MNVLEEYMCIDTFIRKRILIGFKRLNKTYIEKSFTKYCESYCKRKDVSFDNIPNIIDRIKNIFGDDIDFYESNTNTIGILDIFDKVPEECRFIR